MRAMTWGKLGLAVILAAGGSPYAAADAVTRVYDVGALTERPIARQQPSLGLDDHLHAALVGGGIRLVPEDDDAITVDAVVNMIQESISRGTWEGEHTIRVRDDLLIVTHQPETHERIAAALKDLTAIVHREVVIAIEVYVGTQDAATAVLAGGPVLDATRLAALGAAPWTPERRRIVRLRAGDRRAAASTDRDSYVRDVDVSVADGAHAVLPDMGMIHTGELTALEAAATEDRAHVGLRCQLHWCEEAQPRPTYQLGLRCVTNGSTSVVSVMLEQPRVAMRGLATHLAMPSGGAAIVGMTSAGNAARVVVARHLGAAEAKAPPTSGLHALDARFLGLGHCDLQARTFHGPDAGSGVEGAEIAAEPAGPVAWNPELFVERVKEADAASWESGEHSIVRLRRLFLVEHTAEVASRVRARLHEDEARWIDLALVRVRLLEVGAKGAVAAAGLAGRPLADAELVALRALAGDAEAVKVVADGAISGPAAVWFAAQDAVDSPYVSGLECETAAHVAVHDPEIRLFQCGQRFEVRYVPAVSDPWLIQLRYQHSELLELGVAKLADGIEVQRPRLRTLDESLQLRMRPGSVSLVDVGRGRYLWVELAARSAP